MYSRAGRAVFVHDKQFPKSVEAYIQKLARLGIEATKRDFITSSQATVWYLKKHHPQATLYVCGTQSLIREFEQAGFVVTQDLEAVDCIVMGNDSELTFRKLEDVCKLLLLHKVDYIATNPDYVCPTEFGSVPDCGSVCDMIYNCTGRRPIFIGKPEPLMPILGMKMAGTTPQKTAVVGDRIYTDIKSGLNAGTVSVLVMSGETTTEILNASADKPTMVLQSGADILRALKGESL